MAGGGNNVLVVIDRPLPEVSVATLVDRLTNRHDDYPVKPVTTERLRDAVDGLLALADYDATYRTLSQKRVEKSVLAQERELDELAERVGETPRDIER